MKKKIRKKAHKNNNAGRRDLKKAPDNYIYLYMYVCRENSAV